MLCPNCQKESDHGKFCGYCGTQLEAGECTENQDVPTISGEARQVEGRAGNWYFRHAIKSIKRPYAQAGKESDKKESMIVASVSMIAFSLLVPLVFHAYVKRLLVSFNLVMAGFGSGVETELPFSVYVIRPFFFLLCLMVLLSVFIWTAVRLYNRTIPFTSVLSEYGSLLIPMSLIMLAAEIMALAGMGGSVYVLILGLIGAILLLPATVILHHGKAAQHGLDPIYAVMGTYVMTGIVLFFIYRIAMNSLLEELSDYLQWYM